MGQVKGIIDLLKPSALTREKTRKVILDWPGDAEVIIV